MSDEPKVLPDSVPARLGLADESRWFRVGVCECGGRVESNGGMTEEGECWGGNCLACGRGFGENSDEPPASAQAAWLAHSNRKAE